MRSTLPSQADTPLRKSDRDRRTTPHAEADGGEPFGRLLPWLLLLGGLAGALAAFVLTVEKIELLTDAAYVPTCSINPVLNCGSIMRTDQAEVFGFPNPLLGLAGFPVLAATGAVLLAGARLRRWYWLGLQAGAIAGAVFVGWLIFQSLYRIGALCPYCMVVWAVVLPTFWYVTLANLRRGVFGTRARDSRAAAVLVGNHAVVLTVAYLTVLALILERFWDYWSTLLP
ncbi:vitamin K epoxide reductase family protein [Microbacterium sp. ARD31]|uniref:vitamin K epoxide reductase family protein n=1 Tax=Microbacterium sp. ARD31 TaxID=2962576 RepID=UPI0028824255|nr:vitamin K epoxide reductase family protein [Microbacterium sp. ARD31]MDT0186835.1 vitamin K epoxide reductase family protein [Microbacterium sp. ARD31]